MPRMNLFGGMGTGDLYYLKNKDNCLATFCWVTDELAILESEQGLPAFITADITAWLGGRTPPKHRAHMKRVLDLCGVSSLQSIIDYSKGLSLTDTLWCTKNEEDLWENVSLFRNEFDTVIAQTAFDGGMHGFPFSTASPELGTDGMLAKCWVRNGENIYLYKAGTTGASNAGMEPYSEVLAHQVLSRLGYSHISYIVAKYRGRLVSVCPLFTSEDEMFLPLYRQYKFEGLQDLIAKCNCDGIATGLAQHLIFDYLSWNTDRHAGNLGVILDADTFQLKRFAPIFDNGCAMLNYWNGTDDLDDYVTRSTAALYSSFEVGAIYGKNVLGNQHNVERLIGFTFDRALTPGFPEERLIQIEAWLQGRVRKFLAMP